MTETHTGSKRAPEGDLHFKYISIIYEMTTVTETHTATETRTGGVSCIFASRVRTTTATEKATATERVPLG